MLLTLYTLLVLALVAYASSSLYVSYPLDDQLPPIANPGSAFSWSFSSNTFVSDSHDALDYSASALPAWLSFDPATRTLSGTPSEDDEGYSKVTVTASASSDPSNTASSSVHLSVSSEPSPELQIPVEQQFATDNPSLSSVFLIKNSSALHNGHPALRIPPKWSFSIGFDYETFTADNDLYYAARQEDGSPLPDWIHFNDHAVTFDGVTPQNITAPQVFSLVLHASNQEGYSAASVQFDIVVAKHDFSLAIDSLPTINVTAGQSFQFTLNSAVDFSGVLIDGDPVSPDNITALEIDTSGLESWLKFDPDSKTLSGKPPSDFTKGDLPVTLISSVNQTLQTDVAIAAVSSFFSGDQLPPVLVTPGSAISLGLAQYFSNSTGLGKTADVEITAAYNPLEAGSYLNLDSSSSTKLSGTIPANVSYQHIAVTFTAYSHITHSTSHAMLPVSLSSSDYANQHSTNAGGLSTAARSKLILGVKIAFGIICGFVNLAILFALFRRWTRVPDTAATGEEGQRAWTADEKKWYGIGIEVNGEKCRPPRSVSTSRGYGWSEGIVTSRSAKTAGDEDGLGAVVSRVLTRTLSNLSRSRSPLSPVGHPQSPQMIRKVEFLSKVRKTARIVSDKYRRVVSSSQRPVISKPTLIHPVRTDIDGLPLTVVDPRLSVRELQLQRSTQDDSATCQYSPSGLTAHSLIDSPSSSTDGRSIPRRRADFGPPRTVLTAPSPSLPTPAHLASRSFDSVSTESSSKTHEAEAVVQHATRATSVKSAASSVHTGTGADARPRLVPFTNAARVPVPKLPSSFFSPELPSSPPHSQQEQQQGGASTKRVASQMAKVFRNAGAGAEKRASRVIGAIAENAQATVDELRAGIEYVRALGDDGRSSLGVSNARSSAVSFSSLEESPAKPAANGKLAPSPVPRMLARTGERFKFRVPITPCSPPPSSSKRQSAAPLETRLTSGRPLPKFMRVDLGMGPGPDTEQRAKRFVELWGVPVRANVGEYEVGVYERGTGEGEEPRCVGSVLVEVVERKTR